MSQGEKSIVVTILKIFNWEGMGESTRFHLAFYSLKTSVLILERQISGNSSRNEIVFNYSLRISYLEDQNQILIRLSHSPSLQRPPVQLGEFILNLDYLAKKGHHIFPFGHNDKILKLVAGEAREHTSISRPHLTNSDNQQFIREKESYLRKFTNSNSSTSIKNQNSRSKKSFSTQAKELLSKAKAIRQKPSFQHISRDFDDYYQASDQDKMYSRFRGYENRVGRQQKTRQEIKRGSIRMLAHESHLYGERSQDQKSNKSQKHKLQLKNLQMVPVENEYYEPFNQRKLERKSDIQGQNFHSKKKIYRSQFY